MSSTSEPIVGIDLGTTYSLIAIAGWTPPGQQAHADQLAPRIIPDDQGRPLCPSVVRFIAGAEPIVGYDAKASAAVFPLTTISSVKRLMGRSLRDAQDDLRFLPYRVVEGEGHTARIALPDGAVVSPQEVSARILRHLKRQAERALGVPVSKAVVTVPAYFDDAQRQATRDAGRIAGLDVVRIVSEPTAAALAYGLGASRTQADQLIAIYDLGGGTFDLSILRIAAGDAVPGGASLEGTGRTPATQPDAFQVLATAGDTHLGGDDFDHVLVTMFTAEITGSGGPGVTPVQGELTPQLRRALRDAAERAKIALSSADSTSVRVDLGAGRVYERAITRAAFESLIAPLVDRSIDCCRRAMRDAKRQLAGAALSAVVLVGGSSRVPLVRRKVAEFFGLEPYTALDPDQVIALGAAAQASILAGARRDTVLLDVIPLSLGIGTVGGAVAKIIMRNSPVPARAQEMFSTSVDNQTAFDLAIYQGEREMAADCRLLGRFKLGGIPPMPAGIPQLRVQLDIDANGILAVSATELRSGKRATLQVVPNHGLTRAEVDRIEVESFAHAREDLTRHRVVDLIANAKLDLHWITPRLASLRDKLAPEAAARLDAAIIHLREFITRAEADWQAIDANAFHDAKESLDRASIPLHELSIVESLRGQQAAERERGE